MPRLARAEHEAGIHHVYARGNRRQPIYEDDSDRLRYLKMLGRTTLRMNWSCLGYCLMGNHMHLLVETRTPNLGAGMHRLHGSYAQYFNRRYGHSGHLFQDRFNAVPVENDPQLWMVAAYIARNPVDAGLCRRSADWAWGSHAAIVSGRAPHFLDTDRLFAYFAGHGGDGFRRYVDLVDVLAGRDRPKGDSPL